MMHLMTNEALLTTTQAGALAGCSGSTVRRAAENKELPVVHQLPGPNGAMLFRAEDVRAWAKWRNAPAPAIAAST
jgi:excisionase family DNA binding protein